MQALYSYLGKGMLNGIKTFAPEALEQIWQPMVLPAAAIEEFSGGFVYPMTKEMKTKYDKLIVEPLLHEVWIKAMSVELRQLAQGNGNAKGNAKYPKSSNCHAGL